MPTQRVGFLRRFGLKTGIDFAHFGLELGSGVRGKCECVSMRSLFQFQMIKKESVICKLETAFKKYFCCKDDIISVLCKLVMLRLETTSGSENGCGKCRDNFWSKINRVRIWRAARHIPTNNSQGYPTVS